MKRRQFLQSVSALGAVPLAGSVAAAATARSDSRGDSEISADLKTARLEFLRLTGTNGRRAIYLEATTEAGLTGRYGPIASGEHFYGRWDVQKFLERDAIRVVQADPEWCGGVSELVKMCTIA